MSNPFPLQPSLPYSADSACFSLSSIMGKALPGKRARAEGAATL
jgi:hypothetical protein